MGQMKLPWTRVEVLTLPVVLPLVIGFPRGKSTTLLEKRRRGSEGE